MVAVLLRRDVETGGLEWPRVGTNQTSSQAGVIGLDVDGVALASHSAAEPPFGDSLDETVVGEGPADPTFWGGEWIRRLCPLRAGKRERVEAERDRHRLTELVRGTQDAVLSKDLDGIVTSWNPAAERLYGYSAEEAIGRHISFLVPSDRRTRRCGSSSGSAAANGSRPTRPSGSARTAPASTSR